MDITIAEAKTIVKTFVQQKLDGGNPPPIFLWGPPGVGKSDIIRQVAAEKGIKVIDLRLGQMDPVDLRGVPYVEDGSTKWAVPEFFPRDPDTEAILFLDELSSAEPSIQVVAYQLILDGQCGEYHLPPKVYVCAAGNGSDDHAVSIPPSSALTNRMLHLDIGPDSKIWCDWGVANGIAPDIISFIRFCPDILFDLGKKESDSERGWPSPRSWTNVSKILSFGFSKEPLWNCIEGLVGCHAAMEFRAFCKHIQEIGNIREIMLDPKAKIDHLTGGMDVLYAVATSIAYWVWRGETQAESEKLLDGFFRISLQLPPAFAVVAMLDAMSGDGDSHAQQLIGHKLYPEWQKKFAAEMKRKKGV